MSDEPHFEMAFEELKKSHLCIGTVAILIGREEIFQT